MGSRKDLIKRSLGITEYPWSSDDELEEAQIAAEEASLRRPSNEPHPSVADGPGSSGLLSQQPPQQHLQQHLQQQQAELHLQQQHQQQLHPQQQQQQQAQLHPQQQHSQQLLQQQQHAQQQHLQQQHLQQQHPQQQHPQQQHSQQQHSQQQHPQEQHHPQQEQQQARRHQARLDRDLFWSIINSPHRLSAHGPRSRSSNIPVSYVSRVNHIPASELRDRGVERPASADIQRIMAFKRLTRNLSSLHHRGHITGVIPVTRVNPGVIVPSEANSSIRINRHLPIRRFIRTGPIGPLPPRSGHEYHPPPSPHSDGSPGGAARGRHTREAPDDTPYDDEEPPRTPPQPPVLVHSSEDEVNNNPITPTAEPVILDDEGNMDQDVPLEGELEAEVNDNSVANVTEEEIVAIDLDNSDIQIVAADHVEEEGVVRDAREARAGTSAADDEPGPSDGHFSAEYRRPGSDPNMASTSSTASADSQQAPSHGVKRNRQDSVDSVEPYSVKEFNQNLLRLLECPVCLEWMEPPMSQCRRGHLVCGRCRARLASCPVCRTTFSSVRNRAMEGVAEMLRYPCRHGCGREVRLRRRAPHEASCAARKYQCPAPLCYDVQPLPRAELAVHFQSRHLSMLKIGRRHKFSMKVNSEQHDNWLILAMEEYFHLKIDVDIRTWGVVVYVSYIGPKRDAKNFTYEVTIDGQHNQRKLVYARTTHSDLESSSLNVSRQDCFHLTLDQALNFIRFKNRHCDADKFLDFNVEITKVEQPAAARDESDS